MASSTSSLLSVFIVFSLVFLASSSSEEKISSSTSSTLTITLPLTSTFRSSKPPPANLTGAESLSRSGHHHGKKTIPPLKAPLFPRTYGFHAISLSFGTPPQKLPYLLDTGGSAVEAPCTAEYTCTNCSFSTAVGGPDKPPIFYPDHSSSSKTLDCRNPKCARVYSSNHAHLRCPSCRGTNSKNCSTACPYVLQYGTGASQGHFLLENLHLPRKTIRGLMFGCTTSAARQLSPTGLVGFDRSVMSLPVQMGVKKFAYCLNSHKYDDQNRDSGQLILDYGGGETRGISRAPFLKNPHDYQNYYYLGVEGIKIGGKLLPIPRKYLSPGSDDGRNGVIIDSGFGGAGYMVEPVFKIVSEELKKQLSKYRRYAEAEAMVGLSPCYDFSGHKSMKIPDLTYVFSGGAKMVVPGRNYFVFVRELSLACFDMRSSGGDALEITPAPAIILGNSLQVDYYVEYDLKNQRLGFRRQAC